MKRPKRWGFLRAALPLLCVLLFLPVAAAGQADIAFTQQERAYRERVDEIVIGCPVGSCPFSFRMKRRGGSRASPSTFWI